MGPRSSTTFTAAVVVAAVLAAALAVSMPTTSASAAPAASAVPAGVDRSASAGPAPSAHRVYLVKILGRGTYTDPDTGADNSMAVLPVLDQALQRWVSMSAGRITSFQRVPEVRTAHLSGPCQSGSATWNQVDDEVWPGVDFGSDSGNHLVVMQPRNCGGGVGTVGDSIDDGGKITFATDPLENATTLVHEIGHNLGLSHSHANACDADGCSDSPYGNTYSPMGSTPRGTSLPPTISSFERDRLSILRPCEVPALALPADQRAVGSTYDVAGRGTSSGTRGVRVTDPVTGTEYWIDWRNGADADARSTYVTSGSKRPGITVMTRLDATTSQLQTTSRDSDGDSIYSLRTGESFAAGGLRITADRAEQGETWSRVTVAVGDPGHSSGPPLPVVKGRVTIPRATPAGATLTARTAGWARGTCHRYQWYDGSRPIPGALGSTYTVPPSLKGHRVSVRVVGQRTGFSSGGARSGSAVVARFARAPKPLVRGTARVGERLRADARLDHWLPRPTRVRYSWYAAGRLLATGPTVRLERGQRGTSVRVVVTGSRPGYPSRTVASVARTVGP